jgi:hypothetical protein
MNWFVTKTYKKDIEALVARGTVGTCGHEPLVIARIEVDSFCRSELDGDGCAMCASCAEQHRRSEGEEKVVCRDCSTTKPRSETWEWEWYDFYAAQGDKALVVCKECWQLPKHRQRMADDLDSARREDEEAEARAARRASNRSGWY